MAIIVSGYERGLLDSSFGTLGLGDRTSQSDPGSGNQLYVNVANGNLVLQERDAYLPSLGDDYQRVRTYNAQGQRFGEDGWSDSNRIRLERHGEGDGTYYSVTYGDGSRFVYRLNGTTGLYESVDGAGAYETLEVLDGGGEAAYRVTRADGGTLSFDGAGQLLSWTDPNGVGLSYHYRHGRLVQVRDDEGHVIDYQYHLGQLFRITDETGARLAEYHYHFGRLSEVIDRYGHSTRYAYNRAGLLERLILPEWQRVDGELEHYAGRELRFEYQQTGGWDSPWVLSQLTDAEGNVTRFDYRFDGDGGEVPSGGETRVLDALGYNRAYSNDAAYQQWRVEQGYYQEYSAHQAGHDPAYQSQVDAICQAHSLSYHYDANGLIQEVVDQAGYHTRYTYDAQENLTSVTDRNGWGVLHSDGAYYRGLRAELGYTDASGEGKPVGELSDEERTALSEQFTRHFGYDERGNRIWSEDNAGQRTTYRYTEFNRLASTTDPLGHTTEYHYDEHQNLIERIDAGGDLSRFEYDAYGNLIRSIVYLDASDLSDPRQQQVTEYRYDAYGNLIETIDPEGGHRLNAYDHFGNLIRSTDGNGGVTQYSYDADNRLLSLTDPEGNTTLNRYDAVGNRISITDAAGHTVTQVYDRNNRLISTLDPSQGGGEHNRTTQYGYDVVGNRTRSVDAEGRETRYRYDARRALVEVTTAEVVGSDGTTPTRYHSTLAYDGEGNRIRATDNRGFITELVYNENGLLLQQTTPDGQITRYQYDANGNRIQIVAGVQLPAAKRQTVSFSYDEEDQLIQQTDAQGNLTEYGYDAVGNRISVTDAEGHTTDYEYDGNNRLVREIRAQVSDPNGEAVRYTVEHRFDANGNEVETIDENGQSTRYSFDRNDRAVMVEDANGIKSVYRYDSRGNRTVVWIGVQAEQNAEGRIEITDRSQAQLTRYTYDEFNQLIAKVDGMGNALAEDNNALYQRLRQQLGYAAEVSELSNPDRAALRGLYTEHYTYDRVGNRLSVTDHEGRETHYGYDALDRQISQTDAQGNISHSRYDGNGNRVETIDALGRSQQFDYDRMNRLIGSTDALGVVSERVYDGFGNLIEQTRAAGTAEARTQHYEYDLNNRVVQETDPEGHQQSYEYDGVGNRIRVTDGLGHTTRYRYDALNRQVRIMDAQNFQTRMEYDGVGNRLSLIDAQGGISRFEYDAGNRQIRTTDAEGRITEYVYDARGNRIEQHTGVGTDAEQVTRYTYDTENHLRQVEDAAGGITRHGYDRVYNHTATRDAKGNLTYSAFDALNRVIRITDAAGGTTEYAYDAVGNRLSQTDALGRVTEYAYDEGNRVIVETAAEGTETHYGYDRVGNRVQITRAANTEQAVTETFVYDKDDRLVRQEDALGNLTQYRYDAAHNRTQVEDANGHITHYHYDANQRVSGIEDGEGHLVRYRYDGNGNRVQVIDARGNTTTSYYNANNEVTLSVDAEGYATAYEYDANGNLLSQTLHMTALGEVDWENPPAVSASDQDQTIRFEYDALNRVSTRLDGEGYRTEYVYDAVGNQLETRQYRDTAGTDPVVTRRYYDALNREVASLSGEGHLTTTIYDAVGNRLSQTRYDEAVTPPVSGIPEGADGDPGREELFVYDALNRLVRSTSVLGIHTDFSYDARGNRTAVIEAVGTDLERQTRYRYDDADRLVETVDALGTLTHLELDGNGNVVERTEAYGTEDQRQTQFVYDGNNRVIRETQAVGTEVAVTARLKYDGAGNLIERIDALGTDDQRQSRFGYDGNNRRTLEVNAEGERTTSRYDGAGNRTRLVLGAGQPEARVNTFEYDRDNRLIAGVDGEGIRTEHLYDGLGNEVETIQAAGRDGQEHHTHKVYDGEGHITRITDPMGGETRFEYDLLGNQTRVIDANGGEQLNRFDALGRPLESLSAGGILTVNTYDLRGNILSTTQSFADGSDARTTTYAYDALDRQTLVTDPEGFSTELSYDLFGNQTQVTHGLYLPEPEDADYDPAKAAQAFEQSNVFSYDARNRMTGMTDAEGNLTEYGYDAVGNRTSLTEAADSAPRTTEYRYDGANRLIETINPEGGISRNTYDATGNRIGESILQRAAPDADSEAVWIERSYEYDGNARVIAEVDGEGNRTEYGYDAMGNPTRITQGVGSPVERTTAQEYDLNNRLSADIDGEGNRTEYAYDALGNRTRVTDALGHEAHYYYDASGNLSAVIDPEGTLNTFAYDAAGNRTEERVYANTYTGTIDDAEIPQPEASDQDRISTTEYDRNNHAVVQTAPDGTRSEYRYDAAGNLVLERQFAEADVPRELHYVYDLNNRLSVFTDVDGTRTEYQYDGANNKLEERIVNPEDANPIHTTRYEYDLNNREVRQIFDPDGLNYVQESRYDAAGNLIAQVDARGGVSRFAYDLDNRQVAQTDPLGNRSRIGYNAVGDQASLSDANGHTTEYQYDHNGRVRFEIQPEVTLYTLEAGETTGRPTLEHRYDAMGNEVQTVDATGALTTRYFDGNQRLTAELNGENVLRTFSYNSSGDPLSETLYMERLTDAAHDPATLPSGVGEARTTTTEYDLGGRVIRITHPEIAVTQLSGTQTASPTASQETTQLEERITYDAYGNAIVSEDPAGRRTVSYYDIKNQLIAQVDPMGYLTEWTYDSQGNVIEQKLYATRLDLAEVDPDEQPWPPTGEVYQINRAYDVANRLIEERSPRVAVTDLDASVQSRQERLITRYTYDANNNQTSRTLAAATAQAVTEYTYYDGANRRIAVVDGLRVLHRFGYDANGNQTLQVRHYSPIEAGVDLESLDGAETDFTTLVTANENDQTRELIYDAVNRLSREIDRMGSGDEDDLTKTHTYNGRGDETRIIDEDGFVTRQSFDALGQVVLSIDGDGHGSRAEYDAAGNAVRVYTGELYDLETLERVNQAVAVAEESIGTSLEGDILTLDWAMPAGVHEQSFVVYGTESVAGGDDLSLGYLHRSGIQASWFSETESAPLDLAELGAGAGDTLYFRVVSQDAAGNLAWGEEQRITIPPRYTELAVTQPEADILQFDLTFEDGVVNPRLQSSASFFGNGALEDLGNGHYRATLNGVSDPANVTYRIVWEDATGATYQSAQRTLVASGDHALAVVGLSEQTASGGGSSVDISLQMPHAPLTGAEFVTAEWYSADDGELLGSTSVENPLSLFVGNRLNLSIAEEAPLAAGDYRIVLRAPLEGEDILLEDIVVTLGGDTPLSESRVVASWTAPELGDSQMVLVDGVPVASTYDPETRRLVVDTGLGSDDESDYAVYYGERIAPEHTTLVTPNGANLGVSVTLDPAEISGIDGDLHLAWRTASGGLFGFDVSDELVMTASGNVYSAEVSGLPTGPFPNNGGYDLQLYYFDSDGHKVLVDWLRVDSGAADPLESRGHSLRILGSEIGGQLSRSLAGLSITPGIYTGVMTDADPVLALANTGTGQLGGERFTDGSETGYYVENRYNALNMLIGSNAETGLWRDYGVDAAGNVVATYERGVDPLTGTPLTDGPVLRDSYAVYDARNRRTAEFGYDTGEDGRAVMRSVYDVNDNVIRQTDEARGITLTTTYNALGQATGTTNSANGATTELYYDRLGHVVREVDPLGHIRDKYYDQGGRMIREIDPLGQTIDYTYDVFGRRTRLVNAQGDAQSMAYDQRDRLVSSTAEAVVLSAGGDPQDLVTQYGYDGRNNRTATTNARGYTVRQVYDALNRVIETRTPKGSGTIVERRQYDAYGNLVMEQDGAGRITGYYYSPFGRLRGRVDNADRVTEYDYDSLGNQTHEANDQSGKDIDRSYDINGRLLSVTDHATGVSTTYTYNLAGDRLSEDILTPDHAHDRHMSYRYDALGQLIRWIDRATGLHASQEWDLAGNLLRVATDAGYDPLGENSDNDPAYRFVDHRYSYDANYRVTEITQNGEAWQSFEYDLAGNRTQLTEVGEDGNTTTLNYTYNSQGWVLNATTGGGASRSTWRYDPVGNVTRFVNRNADGEVTRNESYAYLANNLVETTVDHKEDQTTTTLYDGSGRVVELKVKGDSKVYFYYRYTADGRLSYIRAKGKRLSGSTTYSYDANDNPILINQGRGEKQVRNDLQRLLYNNDNQILYQYDDNGKKGDVARQTEFLYVNGNPIAETGTDRDGELQVKLDTAQYSQVTELGEDAPASTVDRYTVREGDTLQSIAAQVYGNPSLWFVIAEANGLEPGDELRLGQVLVIPNNIKDGQFTAQSHLVYDQGAIIDQTLPNIKQKKGGWANFIMVLIGAIITVLAALLVPVLAPFVHTALFGTAIAGASATAFSVGASYLLAGAIVGAGASALKQGLFIALGYQSEFSWKSVAAEAVSGALSGVAQGLGALNPVKVQAAFGSMQYAEVAVRALQVSSVASKQLIENGKITSWTSLATAALSPVRVGGVSKSAFGFNWLDQKVMNYVTPWARLAETGIRNDWDLTALDWATAAGETLSTAFSSGQTQTGVAGGQKFDLVKSFDTGRFVTNLAVGGALAMFDDEAAAQYLGTAIGEQLGSHIGQFVGEKSGLARAAREAEAKLMKGLKTRPDQRVAQAANEQTGWEARIEKTVKGTKADGEKLEAPTTGDNEISPLAMTGFEASRSLYGGDYEWEEDVAWVSVYEEGQSFAEGNYFIPGIILARTVSSPITKGVHETLTIKTIGLAREIIRERELFQGQNGSDVDGSRYYPIDKGDLLYLPINEEQENFYFKRNPVEEFDFKKLDSSLAQWVRGSTWPDDIPGYLYDNSTGTDNPSSGWVWSGEYDKLPDDTNDEFQNLMRRSHNADLVFLHSMAQSKNESAKETQKRIVDWLVFLGQIAKGDIKPDTRLGDIENKIGKTTVKELFNHRDQGKLTVRELFAGSDATATAHEVSDLDVRRRAAGAMLHTVQDSFTDSHTARNAEGEIIQFRYYPEQISNLHQKADVWFGIGRPLDQRIRLTPGASDSIKKGAELLVMLNNGESDIDIRAYLGGDVFRLANQTLQPGPGVLYKYSRNEIVSRVKPTDMYPTGSESHHTLRVLREYRRWKIDIGKSYPTPSVPKWYDPEGRYKNIPNYLPPGNDPGQI